MASRLVTAALAVVCAGALASCAGSSNNTGAPAPSGPPEPGASPSGAPFSIPPPSAGALMTLRGQVEQGVEPGCLVLRSGGKTYELMADKFPVVKAGAQVEVTGRVVTGMMSHCMQGPIFQVTSARQG
jgi:hypothetical protein